MFSVNYVSINYNFSVWLEIYFIDIVNENEREESLSKTVMAFHLVLACFFFPLLVSL